MKNRKFKAIPEKTGNVYIFWACSFTNARQWVENHLDLSNNYTVVLKEG